MLCHPINLFVRWSIPAAVRHLQAGSKRSYSRSENLQAITDDGRNTVSVFIHYLLSLAEIFILQCSLSLYLAAFTFLSFRCSVLLENMVSILIKQQLVNCILGQSAALALSVRFTFCVLLHDSDYTKSNWRMNNKLDGIRKEAFMA
jgi:hypothetical protein